LFEARKNQKTGTHAGTFTGTKSSAGLDLLYRTDDKGNPNGYTFRT
jgi:hypothetical protein